MKRRTAAVLFSLLSVAGCVSSGEEQPSLAGTSWETSAIHGQLVLPDTAPSVAFTADGKINGSDGCNRYFGRFEQDGDSLTLKPAGSTMMACPDPIMKQAERFRAAMTETASFDRDDRQLRLQDGEGKTSMLLEPRETEE